MGSRRIARIVLCGAIGSCALSGLARGDESAVRAESRQTQPVRPEVGRPAQAAVELLKTRRARQALAKLREAEAVRDKTPYETYLIERLRAQATAAVGDARGAARAFERAAASPAAPEAERVEMLAGAAGQYFLVKDHAKSTAVAERYFLAGGKDKSVRALYIRALHLGGDYARAAQALRADLRADEDAGRPPNEETLRLLADALARQGDDEAGRAEAMETLLAHYPKPANWRAAIDALTASEEFPARLAIDAVRLKLAAGALQTAEDYVAASRLALEENLPGEAQRVVARGFALRVLGKGKDAERHERLRSLVADELADEKKRLARPDAPNAAGNAEARFDTGLRVLLQGNLEQGLSMMEDSLARGGLAQPDAARLRLAYACYVAGRAKRAEEVLKTVQPAGGSAAALARLWSMFLAQQE